MSDRPARNIAMSIASLPFSFEVTAVNRELTTFICPSLANAHGSSSSAIHTLSSSLSRSGHSTCRYHFNGRETVTYSHKTPTWSTFLPRLKGRFGLLWIWVSKHTMTKSAPRHERFSFGKYQQKKTGQHHRWPGLPLAQNGLKNHETLNNVGHH